MPTFCFICGLIGHSEKYCEKIFDTSVGEIEKPCGSWMKAEPKWRNHTIGAKWLRQGGSFPVDPLMKANNGEGYKAGTIIVAYGEHNPTNLGGIGGKGGHVRKLVVGANSGGY